MSWDVVIVGAGPAGLFLGCKLLEAYPTKRVLLLEKYNYLGGRVVTYQQHIAQRDVQWEIGAGRIAADHRLVREALDRYGLTFRPLRNATPMWLMAKTMAKTMANDKAKTKPITMPNPFTSLLSTKLAPLAALPARTLRTSTLAQLLRATESDGAAYARFFPYWSELYTMRADVALEGFLSGEFSGHQTFGTVAEGFQALPKAMADEFQRKGGVLQTGIEVTDVQEFASGETYQTKIHFRVRDKEEGAVFGKTCVLALHAEALAKLPSLHMPALRHLQMEPLVRMYAVFPVHAGKSWFSGLPSMATAGRIRYIIPVDDTKGVVMISYTDGADARYWIDAQKQKGNAWVQRAVLRELRQLLPDHVIPEPYAFKIHPWTAGCTYWTPGDYDVKGTATTALQPGRAAVFACGESISLRQAWVEGALETVEALMNLETFRNRMAQ